MKDTKITSLPCRSQAKIERASFSPFAALRISLYPGKLETKISETWLVSLTRSFCFAFATRSETKGYTAIGGCRLETRRSQRLTPRLGHWPLL